MRIPLLITLEDDIVISTSSATAGGHESLDYIPGSLVFGAAASKLYATFKHQSPSRVWDVFHSGKVRFQNGYPLSTEGYASYPPPLSIHYYKGEEPEESHSIYQDALRLGGVSQLDPDKKDRQPEQLRKDYITDHGYRVAVNKAASMKTAIDVDTARAATSQLFGYQAIQAGQRFLSYIELDTDISDLDSLITQLKDSLSGRARLGRSRSAQYGRVTIECLESEKAQLPTRHTATNSGELVILCLSDLALTDATTGQPALTPTAQHFGLTQGELDIKNSFMRSRSYSPFNAYRKAFDSQRQVISQGSVIRFTDVEAQAVNAQPQPIGRYTEMGLGHIAINPALCLASKSPATPTSIQAAKQSSQPQAKESPLIQWLRKQPALVPEDLSTWLSSVIDCSKNGDLEKDTIADYYQVARQFNALADDVLIGPSASQWGEVYHRSRNLRRDPNKLIRELFIGDKAICRKRAGSQYSWDLEKSYDQTFALWLANKLLNAKEEFRSTEQIETFLNANPTLENDLCNKITQLAAEMRTKRSQDMRQGNLEKETTHA